MGLKKSNYAMVNNMMRNVLVPICVFYLAKYLSADFDTFFGYGLFSSGLYLYFYLRMLAII